MAGKFKDELDQIFNQWRVALIDGKVTVYEFLSVLLVALAAIQTLVKGVVNDDAEYAALRADVAEGIDTHITPLDIPNVGQFVERTIVDPSVKNFVLGGMDSFRAWVQVTAA